VGDEGSAGGIGRGVGKERVVHRLLVYRA
jgi:hypothetical protein